MSLEDSRAASRTGSLRVSLADGGVLTAVKPPLLTAVKLTGVGLCETLNGLATPLRSLFVKGASCVLAASGPLPGAGEKRCVCVSIGGIFSMLPDTAG